MKKYVFFSALLLILAIAPITVLGQGAVSFTSTQVTNDFPNSISFESQAVSAGADIVKAQFVSYLDRYGASDSTSRQAVDIQPGKTVDLSYEWDTHDVTSAPWSPIVYRWRVTDADGNVFESEPQRVTYADVRFEWKVRKNDELTVRWHDKPDIFGDKVFEIANKAIQKQQKLFGVTLGIPIQIIVYNSPQEFSAWHNLALDWVGGEAFSAFGITTQIVTSRLPDSHWLNAVVPHEISHLYLYQAAYNPTAPVPVWLDEGVAQYNQFSDEGTDYMVEEAARSDALIPLTSLAAGFGQHDEARIRLSYAEGLSAVKYLAKTYGEDGLARLMTDYKKGLPTDQAFLDALGVSMGQFQQDWAESVGASRESMSTPTPWPKPTFPPTPTPMTLGGKTKTPAPKSKVQSTARPTPTKVAQAIPSATPVAPPPATPQAGAKSGAPLCWGLFILLPIPLVAIFLQKRRR